MTVVLIKQDAAIIMMSGRMYNKGLATQLTASRYQKENGNLLPS